MDFIIICIQVPTFKNMILTKNFIVQDKRDCYNLFLHFSFILSQCWHNYVLLKRKVPEDKGLMHISMGPGAQRPPGPPSFSTRRIFLNIAIN